MGDNIPINSEKYDEIINAASSKVEKIVRKAICYAFKSNQKEYVNSLYSDKSEKDTNIIKKDVFMKYSEGNLSFKIFLDELDSQSLLKSLYYRPENLSLFCNCYGFLLESDYKAALNEGILLRNKLTAHINNDIRKNYQVNWLDEKLSIFKKIVVGLKEPESVESLVNKFYEFCEESIRAVGYPYIEIAEVANELNADVDRINKVIKNFNISTSDGYIVNISKSDFEKKFFMYNDSKVVFNKSDICNAEVVKTNDISNKKMAELKYLKDYKQANFLTGYQINEIVKKFNIMVDVSTLLSDSNRVFISETIIPILLKNKRKLSVDISVRKEIYHMENSLKKNDSVQSNSEKYKSIKDARIFLDDLNARKFISYKNSKNFDDSAAENILKVVEKYDQKRFCVITKNKNYAKMLTNSENAICLKVISEKEAILWTDSLKNLISQKPKAVQTIEQNTQIGLKEKPTENVRTEEKNAQDKLLPKNKKTRFKRSPFNIKTEVRKDKDNILPVSYLPKVNDTVYFDDNEQLILTKELASGGEGVIYYTATPELIAKIYHKERITTFRKEKLELMVSNNPEIFGVCWPSKILNNKNGEFIGYLMPMADKNAVELGISVLKLGSPSVKNKLLDDWDRKKVVECCIAVMKIFCKLHSDNILVGDINPRNILINPHDSKEVFFVDCDSYQIEDISCPVGTPIFTSPEIYKRLDTNSPNYSEFLRTLEDEQYAVASLLFQIIMLGQQPYASKKISGSLIDSIKNYTFAFKNSKSDGNDAPDGLYKMIWNNLVYKLKEMFTQVFTGEKLFSSNDWMNELSNYLKIINQGNSTNELFPKKYKVVEEHKDAFKDFTCSFCEEERNMPTQRYNNLISKVKYGKEAILFCDDCRCCLAEMEKIPADIVCSQCGAVFLSNMKKKYLSEEHGMNFRCNSCDKYKR